MLTVPGLTVVFLGVVIGLGIAFVWMLWEFEQVSNRSITVTASDESIPIMTAHGGLVARDRMRSISPVLCIS